MMGMVTIVKRCTPTQEDQSTELAIRRVSTDVGKDANVGAGLGSQVDEDSICRCEIVGFGELRAPSQRPSRAR